MPDDERIVRQQMRKQIVGDYAEIWLAAYNQYGIIKDESARVSAANGTMIMMDKAMPFSCAAKVPEPEFATADKLMPKAPAPSAQAGLDGMPPAFDAEGKIWRYCPTCYSTEVDHVSKSTGKGYQACFKCHQLLQREGKPKPMTGGKA
jgi:hypothetical protein